MNKCLLCGEEKELQKHHVVPKCVIRDINPKSLLIDKTIDLCDGCHKACHEALLKHIMVDKKKKLSFTNIRYEILKKWFSSNHQQVWKEWKVWYNRLIKNWISKSLNECSDDE
jgi:hypothetical protein